MLKKTAQKASRKGDFFMKIEKTSEGIRVTDISGLSLPETLDCGQCFRWKADEKGNWRGVVKGIYGNIRPEEDGITFIGADEKEFNEIWLDYFDFGRDYDALKADFGANEMLRNACEFAPGIRVLRQQPWEAFITFIISQNNNIARIKGIVERLCAAFGEEIEPGIFAFPTPERLAKEPAESFAKIGCGYRADYISSASKEVFEGSLVLEELMEVPLSEAREAFLHIAKSSLRASDVVTESSRNHVYMLLLEADKPFSDMVAERIINKWQESDLKDGYAVTYEMEIIE